ncbi:MAG: methylmalonyl-CoA mutase, partial [Crocinitomicaceae bacterium]
GALDALRDVRKQYQRNHNLWDSSVDDMPVYGTIASQFNDPGMNSLYKVIMDKIVEKTGSPLNSTFEITREMSEKIFVIPPDRTRYLSEISENNRAYDKWVNEQVSVAEKLYGLHTSIETLSNSKIEDKDRLVKGLQEAYEAEKLNFDPKNLAIIENWDEKKQAFKNPEYQFKVRDKVLSIQTHTESLSHS